MIPSQLTDAQLLAQIPISTGRKAELLTEELRRRIRRSKAAIRVRACKDALPAADIAAATRMILHAEATPTTTPNARYAARWTEN